MKIFRIGKEKFIKDLSGEGARLFGGRWNKRGDALLYTSEHLSLCVLEILVHNKQELITQGFHFLEIEIPDAKIVSIKPNNLPVKWRSNPSVSSTQVYGSDWLSSRKSLALKIPSAVLPNEYNILVNPNHVDFNQIKIIKTGVLELDVRLV